MTSSDTTSAPTQSASSGGRPALYAVLPSVCVGALMAGLTMVSAIVSAHGQLTVDRWIPLQFSQLRAAAETFHERNDRWPMTIEEITPEESGMLPFRSDPWKRPFILTVRPTGVVISTLGRDGRPGGWGDDADRSSDDPVPSAALLPPGQLLAHPDAGPVMMAALVSGLLAGLLTYRELRAAPLDRWDWVGLVTQWCVWAVLTSAGLGWLASMHLIGEGH